MTRKSGNHHRKGGLLPYWIVGYQKKWLRPDVMAGLITAAIVIPKAMAYATIAGLPVQIGLYTALIPLIIYAVTGSSRVLSVTTTTTIAILAGSELGRIAPDGDPGALLTASVTLTFMVGAILLVASLFRLGFVANFISEPVLIGFKAGIAVVIVLDQLPKLLGIHFDKGGFIMNLIQLFKHIPETSVPTLIVGVVMVLLLVGLERLIPKAPAPLIVVAAGIAATAMFELQSYGIEVVGLIPTGIPSITYPNFDLVAQLWPGALGIALMSFTETIAAARAFVVRGEPLLVPNKELLATGLSNMGGALFGTMPSGGGTSQTAVNRLSGAVTQMSGIVTAFVSLITMLFLAPLMGMMPQATLAAVVIVYSIGLFQPTDFSAILTIRRTEFFWALTAMAGVILLGTLNGILVAIVVSMIALAQQTADPPLRILGRKPGTNVFRPRTEEHPEDEEFPGLLILRPEGRIFFVNAARIGEKIRPLMRDMNPKVVALDMSAVSDLEYTALKMLVEAEIRLSGEGVEVWLVGMNPEVLLVVGRSALGKALGRERMVFSLEIAVERFNAKYHSTVDNS